MSLVNISNFITPLTNRVHLTTIVLVAVLFATYRLAGGGGSIDYEPRRGEQKSNAPSVAPLIDSDSRADFRKMLRDESDASLTPRDEIEKLGIRKAERPAKRVAPPAEEDGKLIDNMVGSERKQEERKQPGSGLDDIEKSLGLR